MRRKNAAEVPVRVKRTQRALDQIELGLYSEFSLSQCCDYIAWLAQFKVVPPEVWEPMCEQATRIWKGGEIA